MSINPILVKVFSFIDEFAKFKKNISDYSDILGFTVGGGSIPPELCITIMAQRPDIVIEEKKNKIIHLLNYDIQKNQTDINTF